MFALGSVCRVYLRIMMVVIKLRCYINRGLKPDMIVFCFYEGNDYMPFARVPAYNQPHKHIANAGLLESSLNGIYLNPQRHTIIAKHRLLSPAKPEINSTNSSLMWFNRNLNSIYWAQNAASSSIYRFSPAARVSSSSFCHVCCCCNSSAHSYCRQFW